MLKSEAIYFWQRSLHAVSAEARQRNGKPKIQDTITATCNNDYKHAAKWDVKT